MSKEKKKSYLKKLPDGTEESMASLDPTALKEVIVTCQQQLAELKKEMDENKQYQAAKEIIAEFNKGQSGVKSVLKAKVQYALDLLQARGVI